MVMHEVMCNHCQQKLHNKCLVKEKSAATNYCLARFWRIWENIVGKKVLEIKNGGHPFKRHFAEETKIKFRKWKWDRDTANEISGEGKKIALGAVSEQLQEKMI